MGLSTSSMRKNDFSTPESRSSHSKSTAAQSGSILLLLRGLAKCWIKLASPGERTENGSWLIDHWTHTGKSKAEAEQSPSHKLFLFSLCSIREWCMKPSSSFRTNLQGTCKQKWGKWKALFQGGFLSLISQELGVSHQFQEPSVVFLLRGIWQCRPLLLAEPQNCTKSSSKHQ